MTTTDRPYPFFSVNVDKFIAREGEYDVEYNLGQCWIAYNDIVDLYEAAANVVDGGGAGEMEKLRDVVVKVNGDFRKAGLMIDVKEIVTRKPRWCDSEPDRGTGDGDKDNETVAGQALPALRDADTEGNRAIANQALPALRVADMERGRRGQ